MENNERIAAIYDRIDTVLTRDVDNPIYDEKDSRCLLNYLQAIKILEGLRDENHR